MKTLAISIVTALACSSNASAQRATFVEPSVSVAEVFDDNIFITPTSPESDLVLRTRPSLRAGYVSPRFQLSGQYSCDAERYDNHPELNDALARQHAGLHLLYKPSHVLTVSADASYLRTNTPEDFNLDTNIAVARTLADGVSVTPSVTYQFSARDQGRIGFDWSRDAFLGTPLNQSPAFIDARALSFTFDRKLQATDTAVGEYEVRWFTFAGAPGLFGGTSWLSQVALAGWDHQVTRLTDVTLRLGPRLSNGQVKPEWTAGLRQRTGRGEIALMFARSEDVALGEAGVLDIERLTLNVTTRLLRRLELRVSPALARDVSQDVSTRATVGLLDASVSNPITEWFALQATYRQTIDRGLAPIVGVSTIRETVVMLQLVLRTRTHQPEGL